MTAPRTQASTLDLEFVRAQFPSLDDPAAGVWTHAQNAGGSWVCQQVIARLETFLRHTRIQGGDHFPAGAAAERAMAQAAPGLARWLGVGRDEVHIGPSTSQNTYVLARAFESVVRPGDAIVVTDQDHEANSGPWRRLAERAGLALREWQVDPHTGRLVLADLDALLDGDVAIVAFPHVSNIVGEPNPVAEVAARAHAVGAVAIADGVAAAPHGLPDVTALGVDVYLFSAYKTYGPHQGVMVVRRKLADRLPNQGHFFNADDIHKRLVPAGPDHAQVAAMAGVAAYLDTLADHHLPDVGSMHEPAGNGSTQAEDAEDLATPTEAMARRRDGLNARIRAHEATLLAPLIDVVTDRPGVRVLGPSDPGARVPTLSLACERDPAQVAAGLADHHVMAASGHFYAWRVLQAAGLDPERGVLRLSLVHYNTPADVSRIVEGLDALL